MDETRHLVASPNGSDHDALVATAETFRAKYVFPVSGPPIENGCVTVVDGKIVEVGRASTSANAIDLGDVALIPSLINAHTHLEFSQLEKPLGQQGNSLVDWIRLVVAERREQAAGTTSRQERVTAAVRQGLAECEQAGVAAVGEIATLPWAAESFPTSRVRCRLFYEQIGLSRARAQQCLVDSRRWLADFDDSPMMAKSLSPHAPYTVHPLLLTSLCELSKELRIPLAMHLAESPEELMLLNSGSGPFKELLQELGAWDAEAISPGSRPLDYLQMLSRAERALVIHGNFLSGEELDFIAGCRQQLSVVYCPRTFHFFHDADYPLGDMLARGMVVAMGTDSRASNPDLDMLAEMRFAAQRHAEVAPSDILKIATKHGATALGYHDLGEIAVGKPAHFQKVPIETRRVDDPHRLLFES